MSYTEMIAELPRLTPEERRELTRILAELGTSQLKTEVIEREERNERLRMLTGSLSEVEADSWETAIKEDCKRIDPRDW
jgi:hypothetical protein